MSGDEEKLRLVGLGISPHTNFAKAVTRLAMEFEEAMVRLAAFSDLDHEELDAIADRAKRLLSGSPNAIGPREAVSRAAAPYYDGYYVSNAERRRSRR